MYIYIYIYSFFISSNKPCTLRSASPLISAAPLNTALIRILTIFYYKLKWVTTPKWVYMELGSKQQNN